MIGVKGVKAFSRTTVKTLKEEDSTRHGEDQNGK